MGIAGFGKWLMARKWCQVSKGENIVRNDIDRLTIISCPDFPLPESDVFAC